MSSPPPASPPMVWPPSNPSGTVIPFPLPWGQTGCCPPGGMDALMKCYCDLQQASAFIGQVMLDQINNNPAIIQAIIAGIEASGSSLPTVGVTNGSDAQPGQVGEYVAFNQSITYPASAQTVNVSMGVLQPGDWDCWAYVYGTTLLTLLEYYLNPQPAGFTNNMISVAYVSGDVEAISAQGFIARASLSVPTLIPFTVLTNSTAAGEIFITFAARRRR